MAERAAKRKGLGLISELAAYLVPALPDSRVRQRLEHRRSARPIEPDQRADGTVIDICWLRAAISTQALALQFALDPARLRKQAGRGGLVIPAPTSQGAGP